MPLNPQPAKHQNPENPNHELIALESQMPFHPPPQKKKKKKTKP